MIQVRIKTVEKNREHQIIISRTNRPGYVSVTITHPDTATVDGNDLIEAIRCCIGKEQSC